MAKAIGKILICDDEETARRFVREALENEGFQCFETSNTDEIWRTLENNAPDLVLLDIRMPDGLGLDLLPELKKSYPEVLIIAVTAVSELNVAIRCIRQGAYDYITKPISIEELSTCAKRAMETRSLQLQLKDYQHHLEEKVDEQSEEIRRISLGVMSSLSFALESKDSYTAGHSRRVSEIAVAIGMKLGLSEDELRDLRWGGLLHDLAKIAVDPQVLHKEGRLTAEEYEHVMTHPIIGACIAGSLVRSKRIVEIIQHHHAHYDGRGLRQTLQRGKIPLLARIVAVADAYDAMTSNRAYRDALSREEALEIVTQEAGQQFDPDVVSVFRLMSDTEFFPERPKILVADDEESIRLVVKSILGNDYAIIEATNGEEAIQAAVREKPKLIIMDIMMPVKDGVQACTELKSNPETLEIPIVMITGFDNELNKMFSCISGSSGYITKPFTTQALMETVHKLIEERLV
jgi:putative two-component system response regulator